MWQNNKWGLTGRGLGGGGVEYILWIFSSRGPAWSNIFHTSLYCETYFCLWRKVTVCGCNHLSCFNFFLEANMPKYMIYWKMEASSLGPLCNWCCKARKIYIMQNLKVFETFEILIYRIDFDLVNTLTRLTHYPPLRGSHGLSVAVIWVIFFLRASLWANSILKCCYFLRASLRSNSILKCCHLFEGFPERLFEAKSF